MADQQSPQPDPRAKAPASRPLGRAMFFPAAAVVLGALLIHNSLPGSSDAKPPARPAAAASATARAADHTAAPVLRRSAPTRLSIPRIAVNAPFTKLTLDSTGKLNAPPPNNRNLVGWYSGGATPGERGTSIIVGHVDTQTGPAVFLQLSTLKPGNKVDISREDGTVATFEVDAVESFSKDDFPDERVYADTSSPELRLITCGGDYDDKAKDYEENVVVFAHLDKARLA
ncbi:class F sortase [Streptomyces sp. GC420]|uniref:class F sortase n=1 Tax=Streptomyces sp. GC420 TaxID=2697568 RepID=UPI001414F850|nr:class F sortase [Streptomyces sp. GC420]NBM16920.1 class F sortase [Streptomyces sp. GC420]